MALHAPEGKHSALWLATERARACFKRAREAFDTMEAAHQRGEQDDPDAFKQRVEEFRQAAAEVKEEVVRVRQTLPLFEANPSVRVPPRPRGRQSPSGNRSPTQSTMF